MDEPRAGSDILRASGRAGALVLHSKGIVLGRQRTAAPGAAVEQPMLASIIENVRANEALYENIELIAHCAFRLVTPPDYALPQFVKSSEEITRAVYQDNRIYFRQDQSGKRLDGAPYSSAELAGFDGELTR